MQPLARNLTVSISDRPPLGTHQGVWLIVAGSANVDSHLLPRGTLTYRPAGWSERAAAGRAGCTCVEVTFDGASAFRELRRAFVTNFVALGERTRRALDRSDAAAPIAVRAAALHLLAAALRNLQRDSPSWLIAAREMIDAHFREPIHPRSIAMAVGVTPLRLAKAFRREYGQSVTSAIRAARVDAAIAELFESKAPAAAVAARCGFHDASHLIRSVEAAIGMTPASLRERHP